MKEHKKKERLDVLLVKRGFAESREKAKAIIMTGNVFVKEQREDKAGSTFDENVEIEVKGTPMKYVSRGGYKLAACRPGMHGCRFIDRRFYRLYASERSRKSVCDRCWNKPACVEIEAGRESSVNGKD